MIYPVPATTDDGRSFRARVFGRTPDSHDDTTRFSCSTCNVRDHFPLASRA